MVGAFLIMAGACAAQQKAVEGSLEQHIARIDSAFKNNNIEDFNQLVELESLKKFYASIANNKFKRLPGKSRIISIDKHRAYVLLSGLVIYGNSGDETNFSNNYTGIYKFEWLDGTWQLKDKMSIDRANQIKKQNLNVAVMPGKGVKIIDTLTIDVNDPIGFAVKLNHGAKLDTLLLNGVQADFIFSGGLLWLHAKVKKNQKLIIHYAIDVEQDENNKNSGYFANEYGHMRNQYFWHPFFSFSSPNDRSDFSLHCTIPKAYHMVTSLPQKDSIEGDFRIIEAKSEFPTFGLSIYYDHQWEVNTFKKDQIVMVTYTTKDFLPNSDALYTEFTKSYEILKAHFGKPISNYFGIVQDRSSTSGWKNRSNSIVIAGEKGSRLMVDGTSPRATFGHEVAHGWTSPTGAATNFLMEGWATYAESVLLSSVYGDSIITKFFASQKQNYIDGKFDGNKSPWEDYSNGGVSYSKGAWLFYMLANQLGQDKLSMAMKNFIGSGDQSIQSFIKQFSKVAGRNLEPFLLSWLKSKEIPTLKIQQSANTLKISQEAAVLLFPIEIEVKLKTGQTLNKTVQINSKEQTLNIPEGEIESYVLDPKHKLLFYIK